jgi:hypothetical protein
MSNLADLYKNLLDERERDSARFWTIFYMMSLVNALLFGAVATKAPAPSLQIVATISGIAISLIWLGVQRRMAGWISWWEKRLQEVEPCYLAELSGPTILVNALPTSFKLFQERKNAVTEGLSTRLAAQLLPVLFIIVWVKILYLLVRPCFS